MLALCWENTPRWCFPEGKKISVQGGLCEVSPHSRCQKTERRQSLKCTWKKPSEMGSKPGLSAAGPSTDPELLVLLWLPLGPSSPWIVYQT